MNMPSPAACFDGGVSIAALIGGVVFIGAAWGAVVVLVWREVRRR